MPSHEFDCIAQYFVNKANYTDKHTQLSNGDDASIHKLMQHQSLVVSTDTAVAGVHWPHDFPLDKAADRAVCAALSDLAAMGAKARWAWVSVVAPNTLALKDIGQGVSDALNRYQVELAGGDTVSAETVVISITVAGVVDEGAAMQRNQAKVGDQVWLLGKLGYSALGLEQWLAGKRDGKFVPWFSDIVPKLEQGIMLREAGVRCCIDVSDGLLQDAGHLAKASNVQLKLDISHCPDWDSICDYVGEEKAQQLMCSGGEDYALLFTAPANQSWDESFASCIGVCTQGSGVQANIQGRDVDVRQTGYKHFE